MKLKTLLEGKKITKRDFPKKIGEMELHLYNPKSGEYRFDDIEEVEPGTGDYGDDDEYNQGYTVSFEFKHDGTTISITDIGIYDLGRRSHGSISKPYSRKTYENSEDFLKDMNEFWKKAKKVI